MQFWLMGAMAALSIVQDAPQWRDASAETSAIVDADGLDQLAEDFPNSATIQRRILIAAFQAGERERALVALGRLRTMGYGLSAGAFGQLESLIGEEAAQDYLAAAEWRRQPIGASEQRLRIDTDILLAEGLAYDAATGRMMVGSVIGRDVYVYRGGDWQALGLQSAGSIFGLAMHYESRTIWLASGKVDQTPDPDSAFVGLIAIDADTLAEKARYAAPANARSLNDIGIDAAGNVMAADAIGGGIYRLAAGDDAVSQIIAPNRLRGPQGIAIHPTGSHAYIADYGYGIARLDIETGALTRLAGDPSIMLDGVDGLYWADGSLIAVQNGIRPMQITRLDLDDDGHRVVRQVTLERESPHWGEPTLGQVIGDQFHYIANPQWERFGEGGEGRGEAPLEPNQIRSIRWR